MKSKFPSAEAYAAERPQCPSLAIVDLRAMAAAVTVPYSNRVVVDINHDCLRLAVFEGEYRWHFHPDSDELFLVVQGSLRIDFERGEAAELGEWQCMLVPAGVVHRTRAVGRTVNLTFERQLARTVFVDQ